MKKIKKITFILMIMILLIISFMGISTNRVKAINLPITRADLYSKGEVVLFNYDGIGIGVEVIVYQKDGQEYPAYCVNKGRPGVTQEHSYSVDINQYITNNGIWKAIVNGYPFKTPAELGCETMEEAYAATKMAVYDAMYHYDLNKFTIHKNLDSNKRVVAAIKNIITAARNSTDSKVHAILKIEEQTQEWEIDDNEPTYVSKKYSITASAHFETYQVGIQEGGDINIKITNLNGENQNSFQLNEQFKIMIPISELETDGKFNLIASAQLATYPILYGETPNPDWQNFAVTAGMYELADAILMQRYQNNKTEIEVVKQDGNSKIPLNNAVFNLYDLQHKIIHSDIVTDSTGKVSIDNLLPGVYYLKEIKSPDGYYGYDNEIKVEVKLNEKVVVTIENYLEEIPERGEKPQDETHFSVGEKIETIKLPRTGF